MSTRTPRPGDDDRIDALSASFDGATDALDDAVLADIAERDRRAAHAEYEAVRTMLRRVEVPASARTAAIAAAMADHDARGHVPAAGPVAAVRSLPRSRPVLRWLTGVAAAGVVVIAGVALARSTNTPGGDAAVSATEAGNPFESATPAGGSGSADSSADRAGSQPAAESPTAATAPRSTIGSIDGAGQVSIRPPVESPEALAAYAAQRDATLTESVRTSTCTTAGMQQIGEVTYRSVPAVVVRDRDGAVKALDLGDCRVLATAP